MFELVSAQAVDILHKKHTKSLVRQYATRFKEIILPSEQRMLMKSKKLPGVHIQPNDGLTPKEVG